MVQIATTAILVGGGLVGLFGILLAMPQSKLRDLLLPWCFALACGAYILSPVDAFPEVAFGPFGLIDDAGALAAGVYAAMSAIRAGKARQLN
jgi:uncharacterized membrane protein YkvA (DUF1232 family)